MLHSILELIFGIVLVLFSALAFVNAIEFLGYRFELGSSFVGAILSPLFTSLPELTVFLVALLSGVRGGDEIGIGTVFGQPFMASSLSYGLVGLVVLLGYRCGKRKNPRLRVDKSLSLPYLFVTLLFPLTLIPGFFGGKFVKLAFGLFFLLSFVVYMKMMYSRRELGTMGEAEEPLLARIAGVDERWKTKLSFIQLALAVLILYYGSERLVSAVSKISYATGISPLGVALVLIPAATAMPETATALIWGYRGMDTLSLGSLVGEKILYSTFYPGLGLLFTNWVIDDHAIFSVITTTFVSLIILYFINRDEIPWQALVSGIVFFFAYAVFVFALHR